MTIVDLRAKFLPKFVDGARERLARGREQLAQGRTAALARELEALAAEAILLAFHELARAVRKAEQAARAGRDMTALLDEVDRALARITPPQTR